MTATVELSRDRCPVCGAAIAADVPIVTCAGCASCILPDPDAPVSPPAEVGIAWAWTGPGLGLDWGGMGDYGSI